MVVIKQLLSAAEVKEYRALLHVAPWNDGITTAMGMAASVKKNGQADAGDNQVQQLANRLLARLGHTPALLSAALLDSPAAASLCSPSFHFSATSVLTPVVSVVKSV